MEFQAGPLAFQATEERGVETDTQCRIHSSLQQELIAAESNELTYLTVILLISSHKGVGTLRGTAEIAETALGETYVGDIHITVYHPSDTITGVPAAPGIVSEVHQYSQGSLFPETQRFSRRDPCTF